MPDREATCFAAGETKRPPWTCEELLLEMKKIYISCFVDVRSPCNSKNFVVAGFFSYNSHLARSGNFRR